MIALGAAVWHLFVRGLRSTVRLPVVLLLAIVQPLFWLLLFGPLMAKVATVPGFGQSSYLEFMAPGIAVMTALFSSVWAGVGLLQDMERGVLDRFLVTPVSRGALIGGRVFNAALHVGFQAALVLAVAALVGARGRGGAPGIVVALLAAVLLAALLAGCSSALALLARSQEVLIAGVNFVALPLASLSSMIMASALMPGWIRAVARFNPVDWAVVAARAGFEGRWERLPGALAPLAGSALLAAFLATRSFNRYLRSR
jgi:ABC-2 type transport system permease protein